MKINFGLLKEDYIYMKLIISFIKHKKYLILALTIFLLMIVLFSVFSYGSYFRFGFSINFFIDSFVSYFRSILRMDGNNNVYTTFDLIKDVNSGVVSVDSSLLETIPQFALPFNLELIPIYLKEIFFMFFNKETFIDYFGNIFNLLSYSNLIVLMIILLFSLKLVFSSLLFNPVDVNRVGYTKNYKKIEDFNFKVFHPVYKFIKEFYRYIKEKKFLSLYIFIALFFINGVSIIIDFFSYFFLFSSNFSLFILLEFIFSSLYLAYPILVSVPLIIWIVLIYLFIDRKRKNKALSSLLKLETNNINFCKNQLGLVNLVDGLMGGYKTSMITDFALTQSKIFRYDLENNLYLYRSYFPYFNFVYLEKYVEYLAENKIVFNHAQIETLLEKRFYVANNSLTKRKNDYYFGYDFSKYKDYYWTGTYKISLNSILIEYAKNYFYYACSNSYIYSNYSIHIIEQVIKEGYFPKYVSQYFFLNEDEYDFYQTYSHKLDLNEIRIKKYNVDNKKEKTSVISFGIIAYSEAEKDLGNQNSNKIYDLKSDETNPLNDGTDLILKMMRHICTLNYKPYLKMFLDMQRFGDLASKYKDISTALIRANKVEEKCALKFWTLEAIICRFVIYIRKRVDIRMKESRNRIGLIYYLFNKITSSFETYYNRLISKYSYKRLTLLVKGREEDEGEEYIYNLMYAKTFASSYRTDSHYSLFKEVLEESTKGIYSSDLYTSLDPSLDELEEQHSYFNDRLFKLFRRKNKKVKLSDNAKRIENMEDYWNDKE